MRLAGKTAIVTGGASGFGEGIVRKFVAEGARVMIADINGAAAEALATELGDAAIDNLPTFVGLVHPPFAPRHFLEATAEDDAEKKYSRNRVLHFWRVRG